MDYSLADLRAATEGTDGMFGGNGLWFLAILFLFGNGGFGFGGRGTPVTEADLCSSQSFSDLKNQVGRLNDQQSAIARQTDNAIASIGYQNLQNTSTLASQLSDCCCTTQRAIDSVKFDMANYAAGTNAAIAEQTQKVLDAITGNRMADMQAQINQLQLQSAMCGVVRYPTATTYATTCNPFFGGYNVGCGCANI